MAYEIYSREVIRVSTPVVTLSRRGRVVFNVAATKALYEAGVQNVFLLWDKDARKVAVRATAKKDTRSFTIRYSSGNKWAAISAKGFLNHIGHDSDKTVAYHATWDKDLMQMEVSTQKPKQEFAASTKQPEQAQPAQANRNGHSVTRKEAIVKFLRENGPATKGEIINGLRIPAGTAATVLNDHDTFVNRDGRWSLLAALLA